MSYLSSWPSTLELESLWWATELVFRYFDYAATFIWGVSGAVRGARRGYDLTGMFATALVSSCGGGLLRDAVFLQAGPPALVRTSAYVLIALVAALFSWAAGLRGAGLRLLGAWQQPVASLTAIFDGLGLGAFAVVGTRLALEASIGVAGAVLIGVVNAVGGGLAASLLLRETPEVLKPGKLTALAAFAGTLSYLALTLGLQVDAKLAGAATIAAVAVLHWASIRYRLLTRAAWSLEQRRRWARERLQARV